MTKGYWFQSGPDTGAKVLEALNDVVTELSANNT